MARVLERKKAFGWNARTYEFGDLYRQGIIDPFKVVHLALKNAAATAIMILTSDTAIVREEEEQKKV